MKPITRKPPFYGDFSIIKSIRITSISRLFVVFLLFFSSTLSLSFNALATKKNSLQVPAKKTTSTPAKIVSSSKIVKSKKVRKSKKSIIVKKDTLRDIDPATANSPLYNQ
jgi:hypothetical protein